MGWCCPSDLCHELVGCLLVVQGAPQTCGPCLRMTLQRRQEQLDNAGAHPLPLPGMEAGLMPPPAVMHHFPPPYGAMPVGAAPAMPRPAGACRVCAKSRASMGRGCGALMRWGESKELPPQGPERGSARKAADVDAVHAPPRADGAAVGPLAPGAGAPVGAADAAVGPAAGGAMAAPAAAVAPPAVPPPEILPEGWAATKDGSGKTYYWHRVTKKTQWTKPTADTPIN